MILTKLPRPFNEKVPFFPTTTAGKNWLSTLKRMAGPLPNVMYNNYLKID